MATAHRTLISIPAETQTILDRQACLQAERLNQHAGDFLPCCICPRRIEVNPPAIVKGRLQVPQVADIASHAEFAEQWP